MEIRQAKDILAYQRAIHRFPTCPVKWMAIELPTGLIDMETGAVLWSQVTAWPIIKESKK